MADSSLVQLSELEQKAERHRLLLSVSEEKIAQWRDFSKSDLIRILFGFAKMHLAGLLRSGHIPSDYTVKMPPITSTTHPGTDLPFAISSVEKQPAGARFSIE